MATYETQPFTSEENTVQISKKNINKDKNKNKNKNKNNNVNLSRVKDTELALKFFDVSRGEESSYYYFNFLSKSLFKVSKNEFITRNGKVFSFRSMKLKAEGAEGCEMSIVAKQISKFVAQSLYSQISDFATGVNKAISAITLLGKTSNFCNSSKLNIKMFLTGCCSLLCKILMFETINSSFVFKIIDFCLELYRTFCLGEDLARQWKAEVLDVALIAAASMFLPSNLLEIVKRMSLFSTVKICDDIGGFYSFFTCVSDFLLGLFDYLPFSIPVGIKDFFSGIFNLQHHFLIRRCSMLYNRWTKDKHLIANSSFSLEVLELAADIKKNKCIEDWQRRSNGVKNTLQDFNRLVKSLEAFNSSSRVEPTCFTFEGPPGCFKSVLMVKLIKALKLSTYSHVTKSSTDGKDFYDTYANEQVFTMDDVGQQGISQWRNIINIVSPVRLPLDCAAADLKDTKFFTSEIVLLTTNRFENMQGLTKNDGIDNIEALWRRSYVFDFFKTKREGSRLTGQLRIKYFDVNTAKWKFGFDLDTKTALTLKGFDIPISIDASLPHNQILAWMKVIVLQLNEIKKDNYECNDISEQDIIEVDNCMNMYQAEGVWDTLQSVLYKGVDYSADFMEYAFYNMLDLINSCVSTFSTSVLGGVFEQGKQFVLDHSILVVCGLSLIGIISYWLFRKKNNSFQLEGKVQEQIDKVIVSELKVHPSVRLVQKQVFDIHLSSSEFSIDCVGVLSGRNLITVGHASQMKEAYLTVFKNREKNHRLLDNLYVRLEYKDDSSDVSLWSLPGNFPSPFKDLSSSFAACYESTNLGSFLAHPQGILDLEPMRAFPVEIPTPYVLKLKNKTILNYISPHDIYYKLHYQGLCGSLVLNETGKILGIHVAGSSDLGIGVALRIPLKVLNCLKNGLQGKFMKLEMEISPKIKENFSGIKIVENFNIHSPRNSHIIESPLHGVFPITRKPANLSVNGPHTVKDVAVKSFAPVCSVSTSEIEFGKKIISSMLPLAWENLTMEQVIKGTDLLAGINKESSNGFACPKSKVECINFESGTLSPEFQKDFDDFIAKVHAGDYQLKDVLWFETLKDELRAEDKVLPRSFRVSRLHLQLLTKKNFGKLIEHLVQNRSKNEVMIGVNPFTEWNNIYNNIYKYNKWAGDIKSWDGSMLPQVQHAIYEVLSERFVGNVDELNCVLGFLNYCVVAVNDDTYLTTHSMPSGSFLTAMYNSLVNRFYTAMWYYRQMLANGKRPTVANFEKNVVDYVYGDDKLNAIRDPSLSFLNALTMKEFFQSIGMDFTDSHKGAIVTPYQHISEITFLKRSFVYHRVLKQVVGPLDLSTIYSTLSWLDGRKDPSIVLRDKINAFQRELYLHEDRYSTDLNILITKCKERSVDFVALSTDYLINLYKMGEYNYLDTLYGIHY
jgi:hypothetical protein